MHSCSDLSLQDESMRDPLIIKRQPKTTENEIFILKHKPQL